ncbi:MAG: hypothetical protein A3G33_00180 [Omnitrophica bacterium RIFCSPLOWO2_12_FULL_44_17]|uniref:Uncharacterized protein n=1 Tax=Candidatus Danuiimicrobium aquiferis TaxID=1801832 RepID=A0A1G1KTN8_9BACT|nr:MAG: hypothetical protein A3B72_00265 [Omnitrophica bacterium RIFCSPHIGHO2_02_FULL_45_28]OGW92477.1 MAG: hypothetical protein A3E74_10120 [Omnitrophica bacterium RIFCSPHIGHO2_12_FULL_44_12]OGW96215.1 MAG: hypothetical protein A3G33_00180 [Omnitrophica bacterium RIFCSPLOWO2_12_FULL_44_17]OGX02127.1 MAG: hypothetical protein A3J12_01760 [Omnitrophica bacterium RIFCSPLOWO2_02_FULL_44_11]
MLSKSRAVELFPRKQDKSILSKIPNLKSSHCRTAILIILMAVFVSTTRAEAANSSSAEQTASLTEIVNHNLPEASTTQSFSFFDARERTTVKSGLAKGTVIPTFDEQMKKDVLEFDYSLRQGSAVNVSGKNFPAELGAALVSTVKMSVKMDSAEQVNQISAKVEIKGTNDTQIIPINLKTGITSAQEFINWQVIGNLKEVVFMVSPKGNAELVRGTLLFSMDFVKPILLPKAAVSAETLSVSGSKNIRAQATANVDSPKNIEFPANTNIPAPAPSSFSFLDAGERGVLKTGSAKGTITPTFDEALGKDVFEFSYTLPKGSSVHVWMKKFPTGLETNAVNTVRIGFRVPDFAQTGQISMNLELKGTNQTQTIPLSSKRGWNSFQTAIDWTSIGSLNEADFVITPIGNRESVRGTLYLVLDFVKTDSSQKADTPTETFPASFNLMDAGTKGVFNIGASKGNVITTFDDTIGKDIWQFDYSAPKGSFVGVWTQNYPSELDARAADVVRIGIKAADAEQAKQAAVKIEIKGTKNMQSLPFELKAGWNSFREPISWNVIGDLKEVVFVVSPMGDKDPVNGTLCFDLDFGKLTFIQKNFAFIKVGLVIILSLLVSFAMMFLGKFFGRFGIDKNKADFSETTIFERLKRDLFYGMGAVLIAFVGLGIYSLGMKNPIDINFSFLVVGLMGVVIAELFKLRLTGKHLTSGEVFQNILLTGLLAAGSSKLELLQAPATWGQVFTLNSLIATLTFLIYHIANTCSIASSGKQLKSITAAMIVGTPYLFNWLLLVENSILLQTTINAITGNLLAAWPAVLENIGRFLIMFGFNEAVINGIGLATKGKMVKTGKAHWFTAMVSLGVVIAPVIADLGSIEAVSSLPVVMSAVIVVLTSMFSYAGLWGEVYLITGVILDGMRHTAPSDETVSTNIMTGSKKGMAYSGILMALLYLLNMLLNFPVSQVIMKAFPLILGTVAGALCFPFIKTIIETFDGSLPFFQRTAYSYRSKTLYARGAIVGFGFAYMVTGNLFEWDMPHRILFGLIIGLLASGGASILRDTFYTMRGQGKIQSWRLYFVDSLLGGFVGSAMAFYMDAAQVPVVVEKFKLYISPVLTGSQLNQFNAGTFSPEGFYHTYPLVNKWGHMNLGLCTGGAKLLFTESLAGVINWSIAAWLFAINKVFMQAYFEKDKAPIKFFFSRAGFAELMTHMLYVLRWGLWMSPIIFTFLRMMPHATWYNQDGGIRTLFSIYNNLTMSPEAFQDWSLKMFVWVLAFDFFRVLIWMDHMGLRVATLVNLSFMGMDKLDEKLSRFIGPAAAQRYIPEGVKRFTTWAPLLIPFYLPRGEKWDYAWNTSLAMQAGRKGGIIETLQSFSLMELLAVIGVAILVCTGISFVFRSFRRRAEGRREKVYELANREYKVTLKGSGEMYSEVPAGFDVSRRSYDIIDPCGRALYVVDTHEEPESATRFWPVVGNFPKDRFEPSRIEKGENFLKITNLVNGIRTTIDIKLQDEDTSAEIWTIKVDNLTEKARQLKVVPYLEWVLNRPLDDRFHTQYARLYPEMEYVSQANAVLSWQKTTKSMGVLASDIVPEAFSTSRMDFIGRAQSIWKPRLLETMDFLEARDTAPYPTFDPIGSLLLDVAIGANASKTIRLAIGYAKNRKSALELIGKLIKPQISKIAFPKETKKKIPLIGHGEILPGTPQPYSEYMDHGKKLLIHTPYTPRPYDHAMSNAVHSVMVTNRGLHTTCNGNSQQNRLTPDWSDTVTKEIPGEAIYLYDVDQKEWYSPTYHPRNEKSAKYESEFGVDGTAIFRMSRGTVSTELTVFVPPQDPMGVYLLTVKNNSDQLRRMRVAPFFEMVLAFMPERAGALIIKHDKASQALFFENPRNIFRSGWAFASMSLATERVETKRGRFFGTGRGVDRPFLVEKGEPDVTQFIDDRTIAGFVGTMEIPAHEERTVAIVLGQADTRKEAARLIQKYKMIETVQVSLEETKKWWLSLMSTAEIKTNKPEFDYYQNWLKYQALAERIWARRGFYQTSGAFGFRDQLQDTVNLMWVDPSLARKQIILHASQQFLEGDVFHWFFTLTDGRTAFSCRSQASDNPLWVPWAVVEYVKATGDESLLDEVTSYVVSEFPYGGLPKNKHGWGHLYHRSTKADSIYRHCLKSIDLVFEKRTGKNGLPLIQTGDWNDGLDEIGSEGKGESVWLGFFLYYILKDMIGLIEKKEGTKRKEYYAKKMEDLKQAIEKTWREDRYLRAFHDDGTEIGVKGSGIWEIDALTAAWAVMSGINFERGLTVFNTALSVLEKENAILLGWPALREDTKPYLGRSSKYPEGVRENGMYCHGVQWLVKAARILAEQFEAKENSVKASEYRAIAYRLWLKVSPIPHVTPEEIEIYGGQPNKQSADLLTNFDQGRMIWHGYTGAAGWMLKQAFEGVAGAALIKNKLILPKDLDELRGELKITGMARDIGKSPLKVGAVLGKSADESVSGRTNSKMKISKPEVSAEVE